MQLSPDLFDITNYFTNFKDLRLYPILAVVGKILGQIRGRLMLPLQKEFIDISDDNFRETAEVSLS